jgi:predicted RNase H-like HicB family nuclease
MEFEIAFDREEDGRRIAEIASLPSVLVYGSTAEEARSKARTLAQEVVQEQPPN